MLARPSRVRFTQRLRQCLAMAVLPLIGCAQASTQSAGAGPGGNRPANLAAAPRLIVMITVDQMRYDYLERFASEYQSGLARLIKGGAIYTNGFQDHANTETAPGHATVLSGREPYRTGIVLNSYGVGDPRSPLIGGGGPGASPFRFRGTALIDWMKAKDRRSRALSVSRKDRGAILPVGRSKESVFWYASNGNFTTSTYYADTLPAWVKRFNARRIPQSYAGKAWELLLPASAYPEPDTVSIEDLGRETAFPHGLSADTARATRDFIGFPWMDELTVAFALDGVNAMRLGDGPAPDLLAVSLSSTDAVGHRFGMASREMHDQMLRLDRAIGTLIDSLYKLRDSSRIVFALTADHAVTLPPELAKGEPGALPPLRVDLSELAKTFRQAIVKRGGDSSSFDFEDAMAFADKEALEKKGIKVDSLARAFAEAAKREPGVYRADLFQTILKADTTDPIVRRWRHAVPPEYPVVVVVTLDHGSVWGGYATGIHGSPWDDDCHVPIVFYGPNIASGRHDEFSAVVNIGPTLAHMVGASPTEPVDGHVLASATK